jgi:hypothetical protein
MGAPLAETPEFLNATSSVRSTGISARICSGRAIPNNLRVVTSSKAPQLNLHFLGLRAVFANP